jgi:outer membrane protein OmpA-like peptidoglycan-associated protein
MENLLKLFKEALPDNFASLVSQYLGEPEEPTKHSLTALLPALLGFIFRKGSTADGAGDLLHLLKTENVDSGIMSNIAGILSGSGSAASELKQQGSSLATRLFGGQEDALGEATAAVGGIKSSAAMDLLALVVPMVLGFLKKYIFGKNLDQHSLASLFAGQGQYLENRLDNSLLKSLGFAGLGTFFSGFTPPKTEPRTEIEAEPMAKPVEPMARRERPMAEPATVQEPERRRSTRFLPWLVGLLALFAALYFWQALTGPNHWKRGQAVPPGAYCLPANVYFNVGQAVIDPASQDTIAKSAQCIKKDNLKVSLSGYTDQTGDVQKNMDLAKDRAKVVRDALVADGVPEANITLLNPKVWSGTTTGTGSDREARRVEITRQETELIK